MVVNSKARCVAVVSDGASNMRKARQVIREHDASIADYDCVAHGIDLFVRLFVTHKTIEPLMKAARLVVHSLRAPNIRDFFEDPPDQEAQPVPIIPANTRWGTCYLMLKSLVKIGGARGVHLLHMLQVAVYAGLMHPAHKSCTTPRTQVL